jgi:hypothetical protein
MSFSIANGFDQGGMKPFPPTNNTERYLAAILEEARATRDLVDRMLLLALESPTPSRLRFRLRLRMTGV